MRRIKNKNIEQLLIQLKFTPAQQRRKELQAAENLLEIIDGDTEYPFEFVCYKITGFHIQELEKLESIKGNELKEDLQVFISRLSSQIAEDVTAMNEKVYTTVELANELAVSTKTISRWRKKGLNARKFIFDDGKKRVGFLRSAVDKFLTDNQQLIYKAGSFTRLSSEQIQQI